MAIQHFSDGTYRAAWLVPVVSPPLHGGWFRVEAGRVVEISASGKPVGCVDLGDVAVLPALVNAHTHLEFSSLASPIGDRGTSLPRWIGQVVASRRRADACENPLGRPSRIIAIQSGLAESVRSGVGLVGEIATLGGKIDDWFPNAADEAPELTMFAEVLGLSDERQSTLMTWANEMLGHDNQFNENRSARETQFGLSPHAPYSVPIEFMRRVVLTANKVSAILAMHFAECREEIEFVESGGGAFKDSLESIGAYRDGLYPVQGGMDAYLIELERASRAVLVHGNYLTAAQMDTLVGKKRLSVVYCPRTHDFFQHPQHPIAELKTRGVRVALGTDSRASNPDLSIWREAQFLRASRPDLEPQYLLETITVHGADALGRPEFGRIAVGLPAKLIRVPLSISTPNARHMFDSLFDQKPT